MIIKVYDLDGREITTLFEGCRIKGEYTALFDASGLPGGIYFCKLEASHFTDTRKMILLE